MLNRIDSSTVDLSPRVFIPLEDWESKFRHKPSDFVLKAAKKHRDEMRGYDDLMIGNCTQCRCRIWQFPNEPTACRKCNNTYPLELLDSHDPAVESDISRYVDYLFGGFAKRCDYCDVISQNWFDCECCGAALPMAK